jgi:hypothetical protein
MPRASLADTERTPPRAWLTERDEPRYATGSWLDLLVRRDHDVEIVHFALAAGAGDQFKRGDGREQASATEAVQVVGGFGVSAREVHHDVGVNEVRHRITVFSVAWPADAVFVRYAIGDVVAVGPHPERRKFANGLRPLWRLFRREMHFDSRAFGELHILQRLEDAVLVRGGNRHGRQLLYPQL